MNIAAAKPSLDVFHHLLYEINRGLRDLALYTLQPEDRELFEAQLEREEVDYLFRSIEDGRINVYFGHQACVDVVRDFGACPHCHLSPEQDFMLGIMLGYHRTRQCERYLSRRRLCKSRPEPCLSTLPPQQCVKERDDGRVRVEESGL